MYFVCRIDAGARSGHVSDDNVNAIVPHTETSSSGEDTVDNAVVPHNQGTHPVCVIVSVCI